MRASIVFNLFLIAILLFFADITKGQLNSSTKEIDADKIVSESQSFVELLDDLRLSTQTATTVPYLDANKDLVSSSVTPTELGYLSGVTSSIQTQIDSKQASDGDLTALSGLTGTGLVVRDATDSYVLRSAQGTTDEISITNGDGVSGNPAIGLATDPILPGTGAVTVPNGTQAQRPGTPLEGMLRGNTDSNIVEYYSGTAWVDLTASGGTASFTTVTKTANATLATSSEDVVLCDTSTGDVTLTLPASSGNNGLIYRVQKIVDVNNCIIDGNSTETIDSNATLTLNTKDESAQIASDGSNWYSISKDRNGKPTYEGEGKMVAGYAFFGGATDPSNCTSSPCTKHAERGNLGLSATRTGTGDYTVSASSLRANSYYDCSKCSGTLAGGGDNITCLADPEGFKTDGSGNLSFTLRTQTTGGTLTDAFFNVKCEGLAP